MNRVEPAPINHSSGHGIHEDEHQLHKENQIANSFLNLMKPQAVPPQNRRPSVAERSAHNLSIQNMGDIDDNGQPIEFDEEEMEENEQSNSKVLSLITQRKIEQFLENGWTTIAVSILTLWVLFQDDLRVVAVSKNEDQYFYYVTFFCFGIFIIEIFLSSYAKKEYMNSFFFYLDFISTITLLLDIGWISDQIFGSSSSSAKAAKLGTKATRLIRIIRLIRLIRIVKLYKAAQTHREKKQEERLREKMRVRKIAEQIRGERASMRQKRQGSVDSGSIRGRARSGEGEVDFGGLGGGDPSPQNRQVFKGSSANFNMSSDLFGQEEARDEEDASEYLKESNVNKTLTSNINKIVISIILSIMLSVPLFSSDTYLTENFDSSSAAFYQLERYSLFTKLSPVAKLRSLQRDCT